MTLMPTGAAFQAEPMTAAALSDLLVQLRDCLAGLLGTDGAPATALATIGALGGQVQALAGPSTLTAAARGRTLLATGSWTLDLPAVGAAGAGWSAIVANTGSGTITLDGSGAETVDGALTVALAAGRAALLVCTGSAWVTLVLPGTAGGPVLAPNGAVVTGSLTGTAVTQSATDATAGRVMKVGDAGVLGTVPILSSNSPSMRDRELKGGFYGYNTTGGPTGNPDAAFSWTHTLMVLRGSTTLTGVGERATYLSTRLTGTAASLKAWLGADSSTAGQINWTEIFTQRSLFGTVSQSGGVVTGAALQGNASASSPVGGYSERLADGFQRLHAVVTSSSGGNTTLTFTNAFLAGSVPAVNITPEGDADYRPRIVSVSATALVFSVRDSAGNRVAVPAHIQVSGRWSDMT